MSVGLIFAFHYSFPDVLAPFPSQHSPRAACHNFNNTSLSQFSTPSLSGSREEMDVGRTRLITLLVLGSQGNPPHFPPGFERPQEREAGVKGLRGPNLDRHKHLQPPVQIAISLPPWLKPWGPPKGAWLALWGPLLFLSRLLLFLNGCG